MNTHEDYVSFADRWEYKIVFAPITIEFSAFVHLLNHEGESGWELVMVAESDEDFRCIFKRKL